MQRKFQRFRQESILASHLCEFHNNEFLYIHGDSPTTVCVEKAILITTVYLDKHFFDWEFLGSKRVSSDIYSDCYHATSLRANKVKNQHHCDVCLQMIRLTPEIRPCIALKNFVLLRVLYITFFLRCCRKEVLAVRIF